MLALWVLRIALIVVAVATSLMSNGRTVPTFGLWVLWALLLAALIVPAPESLLVIRAVSPAVVITVAIVAARATTSHRSWLSAVALVAAGVLVVVGMSGDVGRTFVQASAYGHEERFPLRVPAALVVPLGLSWLVWTALAVGTVAFDDRWVPGTISGVAALGLGWLLWNRALPYVRRWLVVLPNAVVVHDATVLAETLRIERREITSAGLALVGTEAFDLTGPASGRAVELTLTDAALVVTRERLARADTRAVHARAVLVAPSRPGAVLVTLHAE